MDRLRARSGERMIELDILNKEATEEAAQDYLRILYDMDEI
ncbi:MAG: hypothetical protein ACYC4H_11575 [Desulfocucumaceae bacterium]